MDFDTMCRSFATIPAMLLRQLERIPAQRDLPARYDLALEDEPQAVTYMVVAGFACRYGVLPRGRRQILAYLVPGDCFDLGPCLKEGMDHFVSTLTPVKLARLPRSHIGERAALLPELGDALADARR